MIRKGGRSMRRAYAIALVAAAVAASAGASDLGSIVNSFPARIYGHGNQMMPVGIEYAFGDLPAAPPAVPGVTKLV